MSNISKKRFALICAAAGCLLMLYGSARGEVRVVHDKAVNICFECIGIG